MKGQSLNDNERKGLPASIDLLRQAAQLLEHKPKDERREKNLSAIINRVKNEMVKMGIYHSGSIFKHKKLEDEIILFVKVGEEIKPISFYDEHSPYSGTMSSRGTRYPIEIIGRHMKFVDFEKAKKMKNISEFTTWINENSEARKAYEQFLEENNIFVSDIQIMKIEHQDPIEKEVDIDLTLFI